MIERFQAYFHTLEGLSTEELDRSAERLVRAEKTSEGAVAMRLQVANVSRRFPQLLVALAENRLSLTVAGLLAPHLTESNVEKLLSDCAGMTKREVEEYLVALRPKPVFAPSIRKMPSSLPVSRPASSSPPPKEQPMPPPPTRTMLQPATPEMFNFRFAAGREFKAKLERLAEVLGVENPLMHMAEILEKAVDIALDRKDVQRKRERRLERQAKRSADVQESRPDEISAEVPSPSRHIASAVRERVHARADYQCDYHGPDGTRCRSRTGLEIEHLRPFALHHSHDERYLRLYCRRHNRLSAERVYGAAFIRGKIDASRRRSSLIGHANSS